MTAKKTTPKPPQKPRMASAGMERSGGGPGHGAPKCGAPKKQGPGTCQNPAGFKTDHVGVGRCHLHLGNSPSHRSAGARELVEREHAAASARLGLAGTVVGTDAVDAVQENLDQLRADFLAAGLQLATHEPEQWAQRDAGGKYLRPSLALEIYWRCQREYARYAQDCVSLGIAQQRVSVERAYAEEVVMLLQAVVSGLGLAWEDKRVQAAVLSGYRRLEIA